MSLMGQLQQDLLSTLDRAIPFQPPPKQTSRAPSPKFLTYYQGWDVYCRCIFSPGLFLLRVSHLGAWAHSLSLGLLCDAIPLQQVIREV